MNTFTIKDLENLSGIKAHTIRIWEQRYNFLKPERTQTNIRCYSDLELKKLLNVTLLYKYGFKISHIDKMDDIEMEAKILLLTAPEALQERMVNALIEGMIEMDSSKLESAINRYVKAKGMEKTIIQIIFPFLEKIGVLWLTSHISAAQEHLVSNIIRQKLIAAIDGLNMVATTRKTVLLFLPEGEYHELGLLFVSYMLQFRGVPVIYLGANVPVKDVAYAATYKTPSYLFTHITSVTNKFKLDTFITAASQQLANTPLIISGQQAQAWQKKTPAFVQLKKSYAEVVAFIESL